MRLADAGDQIGYRERRRLTERGRRQDKIGDAHLLDRLG
jgi:hypothetical protein